MRPRKWVLVAAFFSLIIIVALYQLKRHVEKNRDLENLLIQSISPLVKGTIDVRKIRLGFLSAHLYGTKLTVPLESFSVHVDHIKIGFSFSKLLTFKGDYNRAINKIILIKPEIFFTLNHDVSPATGQNSTQSNINQPSVAVPEELPVPYLIIKNGKIWFGDKLRDTILIGEHLYGTLTDEDGTTVINLNGKSGSSEKNLQINGTLAWNGGNHTMSMYLKRAAIKKPITFNYAVISSGILSGNMTFVFPDTLTLDRVSSSGKLTIEQGTVVIEQLPAPLSSVSLHVKAHGSTWSIDSLSGYYRSSLIKINGECNLADTPYIAFDFLCLHVKPESLSTLIPPEIAGVISGEGWISGHAHLLTIDSPVQTSFRGEGFNFRDIKNIRFTGACSITDSAVIGIDSLALTDGNMKLLTSGTISIDSVPVYNLSVKGSMDSLCFDSIFDGSIKVSGSVIGSEHEPRFDLLAEGRNLVIQGYPIGNQAIAVTGNSDKVKVAIRSHDSFTGYADILSPFSDDRTADLHLNIGTVPIKSMLNRSSGIPKIDSAALSIDAHGWIDSFEGKFSTQLRTTDIKANLAGTIQKKNKDQDLYNWTLNKRVLEIGGNSVDFSARGKVSKDSLVIDSLAVLGGISANGSVYFNTQPVGVDASCNFRFTIPKLFSMVPQLSALQVSGNLYGRSKISGAIDNININSEVHIRDFGGSGIQNIQTDAIVSWHAGKVMVLPVVIRKDMQVVAAFDTIIYSSAGFSFSGEFDDIDLHSVVSAIVPRDLKINSHLSGCVKTTGSGFPILVDVTTPSFKINKTQFDSITFSGAINPGGLSVKKVRAQNGTIFLSASGYCPWSVLDDSQTDADTLKARIEAHGDFLKYLGSTVESPITGTGVGKASVAFYSIPGTLKFTEGLVDIPQGVLSLRPFVLSDIKNFTFLMEIDSAQNVHTTMSGLVKRRSITIFSTHDIPEGFESFYAGPLNFGMFQVKTPEKGIDIHLPGFMPIGEIGDIEFLGKEQCNYFTLSGPFDKLRITGTWMLRSLEFTFPFLVNNEMPWDFDPFPYVSWDLDLKAGDRRVLYFWDLSGKKRRILRFLEGYLDPTSIVKVRGRDMDYSFKLYGQIRSYKGAAYYGKMFDRNFNVGLDFEPQKLKNNRGYDNLPIIWGSAEALSDSSRLKRTKITCMIHDPKTRAISERGRLVEGKSLNFTFQLSSNFEEQPGENERDFFKQAGLTFTTIGGAGEFMSDFGERYFHRYLLERWERKFAKIVGLDVINIESSITSNYFSKLYGRQFEDLVDHNDYLALANVGVTVGRYFFHDYLFLKARGGLIPMDTLLRPEYSIGMELQPNRFLVMDLNYGVHKGESSIEHNPRLAMQLTLPINKIRKLLKF